MMNKKENLQSMANGGLAGVVLGAGTVCALNSGVTLKGVQVDGSVDAAETVSQSEEIMQVATGVNDDMSFNDAFATARAETGPGGLFAWRGNVYGTYMADEWNAMSVADKEQFTSRASTVIRPTQPLDTQVAEAISDESLAVDDRLMAEAETIDDSDDVRVAETIAEEEPSIDTPAPDAAAWDDIVNEENDVRIVGFKEIEIGRNRSVVMQELDVNGQRVAVVDVDKDGVADLAMTDLNHNQQMDEGEVIDLHTGEAISFANDDTADATAAGDYSDIDMGGI